MYGARSADPDYPDTRWRYQYTWSYETEIDLVPVFYESATAYVDKVGGFVYTLFTSDSQDYPRSNNWRGCAWSGDRLAA